MLLLAVTSLRDRWVTFTGTFVTLVVSVALLSAAGLLATLVGSDPALAEASGLLGLFAGIGAFLTVFVVAGTVAFTVSLRRREFAVLRMAGASPRQLVGLVITETLLVSVVAALIGTLLGVPLRSVLAAVLEWKDVLPAGSPVPDATSAWPMVLAVGLGIVVAILGAVPAARRAGRVSPVVAFSEGAVDTRRLPLSRWVLGLVAFGGGVSLLALLPSAPVEGRLPMAMTVSWPIVIGLALLGPSIVPAITGIAMRPLEPIAGVTAQLARQNLRTAVRRTASSAAPVLATIDIACSLLAGTALLGAAERANSEMLYTSDYVATGTTADPSTLPDSTLVEDSTVTAHVNRTTRAVPALGVTRAHLSEVLGLGTVTGNLDALTGDTAALATDQATTFGVGVGDDLDLDLSDGTHQTVRVVALYEGPPLTGPMLLPADLVPSGRSALHILADRPPSVPGAHVTPTSDWLDTATTTREDGMRIGAELLAWFALLYTLFAVANTVIMSFGRRRAEFAQLLMLGATRTQVLRMTLWETVGIGLTGLALGTAATVLSVGGLWQSLRAIGLGIPLDLPWTTLIAVAAGCMAVLACTSLAAASLVLRRTRFVSTG